MRGGSAAAVQTGADRALGRDQEGVRAQIIAAGHRLFDRIGEAGFTLSAVASEAEFAPATIYAYFSSRQKLLSLLSHPEEGAEQPELEPGPEAPAVDDAPQAVPAVEQSIEEAAVQPGEVAGAAAGDTQEDASAPASEGRFEFAMRAQAQALDDLAKRVIVPKSMRREGTDVALSRIEARLSVTEQSLATLEKVMGENLRAATDDTAVLTASLRETRRRIDMFEEKQLAALAELRLDIYRLASPTAVTAPVAVVASEPHQPGEPIAEAFALPAPEEAPLEAEMKAPEPDLAPARPKDYLSNARAAAKEAAVQASPTPKQTSKPARRWPRVTWRRHWKLIVAAAVLVVAFDAYVFVRFQPARAVARRPTAAVVVAKPAARRVLTPQAQLERGLRYLNGTGVATNVEKAAVLIERAATNGLPVAQNYLGVLYQTGTGVHANMATAVRWYEAAARNGNLKAMTNLGKAYAGGWAEGTDFTKAAEWFGRAAGFGDIDAQFDLAILYESGQGVSRNVGEAYKWYVIAGAKGDANAASRATVLSAQLSPNELLAAQAAAALFRAAPIDSAANDVPR